MRVLHLYSGNLYGGVESLLVTLARHRGLCPDVESVFALCFEGRLSDELRATGAPVHLLGGVRVSRPWTVWAARRRLHELLARRFDAVVCHSCWPHVIFAPVVRRRQIPLVFWAHDVPAGRHWVERWARRTPPDFVVANSRLTQSCVKELFAGAPSEVIHYPVAGPALVEAESVRRRVRESLHTPESATVIIQACRLERWKGHHLLLDALASLAGVPDWECWVAGGAQRPHELAYLEELRQKASRLGLSERVRFLGQRGDVRELLAAADIHCQPNVGPEPFGIAFVEALYAGLPVVSTAMGGALEIVEAGCGVLVAPGEPGALADALSRLIRDGELRRQLGSNGPERARQMCDPGGQLRRLRQVFHSLTAAGRNKEELPLAAG